ncbi:hypothetical protein FRC04_010399 [Tulasnella sp. 424]|nr:hypothetical protein FRC04_010399 [Tulasnella sp. 424]KAG8978666.1 hypothetical protein FRC05_009938 [Tulasnella sp. 425]
MGRFKVQVDEATLLKAYRIESLDPQEWQDVDHETIDSLAGGMTSSGSSTNDAASDPLGLGAVVDVTEMSMEQKASVLISSKSFDPKAFLSVVHPDATYEDLAMGTRNLQYSLESRSEAIRILVEENFDRFVSVKFSADALYVDMKEGLLADSTDFASSSLKSQLKLATAKADQVFLPVLENASKADKLRSTLAVFERSKFFFNLPGSLREAVEARRYDAAMRDYKKGKFLLESKPGQLLPASLATASGSQSQSSSSAVSEAQKRIFDKVWAAVEKVMSEMRETLLGQLKQPNRGVEEQEKTIEILLELDPSEEPIWTFLDGQHKHALDSLRTTHEKYTQRLNGKCPLQVRSKHNSTSVDQAAIAKDLETCIVALNEERTSEQVIAKAYGWEVWQSIWDLLKAISEVVISSLPGFWKIARAHMNGNFQRAAPPSTNRRSPNQTRTMALDIVKEYIAMVSEFFNVSDPAVKSSPKPPTSSIDPVVGTTAAFVPLATNSLTSAHFLQKILSEIAEVVNDVTPVDISSEANFGLSNLLISARWKFEEVLCGLWERDAHLLNRLETWELNREVANTTTYLTRIHKFQKHNTTGAYKIATISGTSGGARPQQKAVPSEFTSKITKAFLDCLYAILDGFIPLATEERDESLTIPTNTGVLDLKDTTALRVINELDKTLFGDYIKPKSDDVTSILRAGILDPAMDWLETPRPTEVRQYVFSTLLRMVDYHSKVGAVSKTLLERTMTTLVADLTAEALKCFKQIRRFGMGGMLRATLEIEFIHQTLQQYVTPTTTGTFTDIYTTISDCYERRPDAAQQNLQAQLDGVKQTLSDARKATAINFVCFRRERTKSESAGKERERAGTPKPERERMRERTKERTGTGESSNLSDRTRERTGTRDRDADSTVSSDRETRRRP